MWQATTPDNPDGLTDRAIRMLHQARDFGIRQSVRIAPEHVLWALTQVERSIALIALQKLGVDLMANAKELENLTTVTQDPSDMSTPSDLTIRLLEEAKNQAAAMNHNYIATEHLIMGLLCIDSPATSLLKRHGIDLVEYQSIIRLLVS